MCVPSLKMKPVLLVLIGIVLCCRGQYVTDFTCNDSDINDAMDEVYDCALELYLSPVRPGLGVCVMIHKLRNQCMDPIAPCLARDELNRFRDQMLTDVKLYLEETEQLTHDHCPESKDLERRQCRGRDRLCNDQRIRLFPSTSSCDSDVIETETDRVKSCVVTSMKEFKELINEPEPIEICDQVKETLVACSAHLRMCFSSMTELNQIHEQNIMFVGLVASGLFKEDFHPKLECDPIDYSFLLSSGCGSLSSLTWFTTSLCYFILVLLFQN